ncbi:unnamed protein product [Didymodactylos carnosus]|uniref:Uncharacterized protein n=1 Tax=Didymodactylos carnosus TaxID=1234261 RepID=A0A814SCM5_9BILA|nr:unnamed protein product [Didymodactylos carnosus]CAF1493265.1 unnamed protein product [Didymodactylos carnosus]CAF3909213.1 unnamed protein product [Didymodactylos carnosus]CAF4282439.1 unnamed protein product [Didymodactylos carnosus]
MQDNACVNVSPTACTAYQTLAEQQQFSNWFCPKCLSDETVDRVPPRCLQTLSDRIDKIEHHLTTINDTHDQLVDHLDKLNENLEQEKRRKNIIVKNLSPVEGINDRVVVVRFVQDDLGINIHPSSIDSVWRFKTSSATTNDRPPLLDIAFNDLSLRSSILAKALVIKNSSDVSVKIVYIGKHLTKQQSLQAFEARQRQNQSQQQQSTTSSSVVDMDSNRPNQNSDDMNSKPTNNNINRNNINNNNNVNINNNPNANK